MPRGRGGNTTIKKFFELSASQKMSDQARKKKNLSYRSRKNAVLAAQKMLPVALDERTHKIFYAPLRGEKILKIAA